MTPGIWWSSASANEVTDCGRTHHDFNGGDAAAVFLLLSKVCVSTASSVSESWARNLSLLVREETLSMMRSTVFGALDVRNVAKTRCPVSAAVKAS